MFKILSIVLPERPKNNDEDTHIVSTSSHSNGLVTDDSRNFRWFSPVGYQFLSSECDGILWPKDIK